MESLSLSTAAVDKQSPAISTAHQPQLAANQNPNNNQQHVPTQQQQSSPSEWNYEEYIERPRPWGGHVATPHYVNPPVASSQQPYTPYNVVEEPSTAFMETGRTSLGLSPALLATVAYFFWVAWRPSRFGVRTKEFVCSVPCLAIVCLRRHRLRRSNAIRLDKDHVHYFVDNLFNIYFLHDNEDNHGCPDTTIV